MASQNSDAISLRHPWPERLFHWSMALTVLILLLSAFLPIVGIKFDWIPWHWIAGVVLMVLLIFHILRVFIAWGLSAMLPNTGDLRELWSDATGYGKAKLTSAKYGVYQKSIHWLVAILVLGLVVTGLPMLLKLDTVFWRRDPSLFSDIQWGYIYVIHGLCALALIFLVILHIYFALLPEHKKLLLAMLTGRGPQNARMGRSNLAETGLRE